MPVARRCTVAPSLVERVAHLAEYLHLAEDERVEPGCDSRQMTSHVLARVDVEMVEERRAIGPVSLRERIDENLAAFDDALDEVGVELDPVARREHGVLVDLWAPVRAEAERAEPLPQLDGSRPVTDPEADQAVHDRRTTLLVAVLRTRFRMIARRIST